MANKKLVGVLWVGCCPNCLDTEMLLNSTRDKQAMRYECPQCGLQIRVSYIFEVMPEKGKGNFVNLKGVRISAMEDPMRPDDLIAFDRRS